MVITLSRIEPVVCTESRTFLKTSSKSWNNQLNDWSK
jgi:hypothetical protein